MSESSFELPLISVNLWAFTSAKDLYLSLESLLQVDYQNMEILIACSEEAEAIKELAYQAVTNHAGIRVVELDLEQSRHGAQILWEQSRGSYVAPVLAGTRMHPETLHLLHITLAEALFHHPETWAVLGRSHLRIPGQEIFSLPHLTPSSENVFYRLSLGIPMLSGVSLLNRQAPSPFSESHLYPYFWWGSAAILNWACSGHLFALFITLASLENFAALKDLPGIRSTRDQLISDYLQQLGLKKLLPHLNTPSELAQKLEQIARNLIENNPLPAFDTALWLVNVAQELAPQPSRQKRQQELNQKIPIWMTQSFPKDRRQHVDASPQEWIQAWRKTEAEAETKSSASQREFSASQSKLPPHSS